MRILIDIGHPAHVHYFRNFIKIMETKGHEFLIVARDKEVAHKLLEAHNINYFSRGKGGNDLFHKLFYFLEGDYKIFRFTKKFKPELLLSFASPYLAQISKFTGIPHIVFDDTQHNIWNHWLYAPLSATILTPACFSKNLGTKQIYFNGYMELCYLLPKYFKPTINIYEELGLKLNEKYLIMRFVSWNATHDKGHTGISYDNKIKAIDEFKKYVKVFISSESELPYELKKFNIPTPPHRIHDVIANASLVFGESATMASEAAVLGVPSIYLDNDGRDYTNEEEKKYGLVFNFSESEEDQRGAIQKGIELLTDLNVKLEWQKRRMKMLKDKIDVTAFMVWFIEDYPISIKVIKENPMYQNIFRF